MKPTNFNILRNIMNSLRGLADVYKNETAFRIEVIAFILLSIIALYLDIAMAYKLILILSLPIVLIAEVINSSIERAVDTATLEYDENAKKSKDSAATVVLFAIIWVATIWICVLYLAYCS